MIKSLPVDLLWRVGIPIDFFSKNNSHIEFIYKRYNLSVNVLYKKLSKLTILPCVICRIITYDYLKEGYLFHP